MNKYTDEESMKYEGPEWEAAKAAFHAKWGDTGVDYLDMLFDDFYAGWHGALRWKERQNDGRTV